MVGVAPQQLQCVQHRLELMCIKVQHFTQMCNHMTTSLSISVPLPVWSVPLHCLNTLAQVGFIFIDNKLGVCSMLLTADQCSDKCCNYKNSQEAQNVIPLFG